jgi:hypothetical protein
MECTHSTQDFFHSVFDCVEIVVFRPIVEIVWLNAFDECFAIAVIRGTHLLFLVVISEVVMSPAFSREYAFIDGEGPPVFMRVRELHHFGIFFVQEVLDYLVGVRANLMDFAQ